ncbi:MAG: hypothetical protein ACRD72_00575 [Candidatus Angelobacter sp.]
MLETARQSIEPRAKYEMFILSSLFWSLVQIPLSYLLFFAKLFAADEQQQVMRIALIDGPLREVQLLGFAALIIAGVSQRFVPHGPQWIRCSQEKDCLGYPSIATAPSLS